MPVRKKAGESKDEFIQRCMSIEEQAFPDENQRYAVCISYYEDTMKKQSTEQRVADKLAAIEQKRKDIEQQELEGACWPNYIQIGTKIKDGREVPDCRGPVD